MVGFSETQESVIISSSLVIWLLLLNYLIIRTIVVYPLHPVPQSRRGKNVAKNHPLAQFEAQVSLESRLSPRPFYSGLWTTFDDVICLFIIELLVYFLYPTNILLCTHFANISPILLVTFHFLDGVQLD